MKAWIVVFEGRCRDCPQTAEGSIFALANTHGEAMAGGARTATEALDNAQHRLQLTKLRADQLVSEVVIAAGQQLAEAG